MLTVLKSLALFSVKLVAYPVLAVVAIIHGLLFGFASTVGSVIKHFGSVVMLPFAAFSVLQRSKSGSGLEILAGAMGVVNLFIIIFGNVPNIARLFDGPLKDSVAVWLQSHNTIILTLTATNLCSVLYEGGRAYCDYLFGKESSQSEVPEAKIVAPQSHLTMFSKIYDKDKVSEEEAWTLLVEAVAIGKDG